MADNKKGCFVKPEEIDELLENLASDFEVSDTSDESEFKDKFLVLLTGTLMGYFAFLDNFFAFEKEIFRQ